MKLNIEQYKTLTNDETKELIRKYRETKDHKIKDYIILHNLKLVGKLAHKIKISNIIFTFDDLFQLGTIGLIKAVETFNIDTHNAWSTYAGTCIKNEMLIEIRRVKQKYQKKDIEYKILSIDDEKNMQYLLSLQNNDMEKEFENLILINEIMEASSKVLNDREKKIIRLRYKDDLTQAEIGKIFHIGKGRVSTIEKNILSKLKKEILK